MVIIKINNKNDVFMKTYDLALRYCAKLYKQGVNISDMKIINSRGTQLPVSIKHLTNF